MRVSVLPTLPGSFRAACDRLRTGSGSDGIMRGALINPRYDPVATAPGSDTSIDEAVFLTIAVQQLFQETFVGEGCQVILRPQLEEDWHRDTPRHPLTRVLFQVPPPAQKTFHHHDFLFR